MPVMWVNQAQVAIIYCLLFVGANFVNKYVLSVLRFAYPTIFQSWQTLVGFIVLHMLTYTGKVNLTPHDINRSTLGPWVPVMVLYVISIYSGSVALSKLPIPVFMVMTNLTTFITATGDVALQKKMTSACSYISLMTVLVSSLMVSWTDPQHDSGGYHWMCIHIAAIGISKIYTSILGHRITLGTYEKMYSNYVYSVIVLVPSSYLLGDALAAKEFPFLYFSKFYVGCILSGVFGVFLALSGVRLQSQSHPDVWSLDVTESIAKIVVSLASLLVFHITLTSGFVFWVSVNLIAGVMSTSAEPAAISTTRETTTDDNTQSDTV